VGVTMQSGRTMPGVRNLGFRMDDTRTELKEGEPGVNRSWLGTDAERHRTKSPAAAQDGAGA